MSKKHIQGNSAAIAQEPTDGQLLLQLHGHALKTQNLELFKAIHNTDNNLGLCHILLEYSKSKPVDYSANLLCLWMDVADCLGSFQRFHAIHILSSTNNNSQEQTDFFEHYERQPQYVIDILSNFSDEEHKVNSTAQFRLIVAELKKVGFTCDMDADFSLINLYKISH